VGPTATSLKHFSGNFARWRGILHERGEDDSAGFPTLSNTVLGPHRRHFVDDLIMSNKVYVYAFIFNFWTNLRVL
jgi:hypothetical protein